MSKLISCYRYGDNMIKISTVLIGTKIIINGTGFIISYISIDAGKYIPGMLLGFGLILISLIIPEK